MLRSERNIAMSCCEVLPENERLKVKTLFGPNLSQKDVLMLFLWQFRLGGVWKLVHSLKACTFWIFKCIPIHLCMDGSSIEICFGGGSLCRITDATVLRSREGREVRWPWAQALLARGKETRRLSVSGHVWWPLCELGFHCTQDWRDSISQAVSMSNVYYNIESRPSQKRRRTLPL